MNHDQFDNLTREFGKGISRRNALKLLFWGTLGSIFLRYGVEEANAAPQLACPDLNSWPDHHKKAGCLPQCPGIPPAFPPNPPENIVDGNVSCSEFRQIRRLGALLVPTWYDCNLCDYAPIYEDSTNGMHSKRFQGSIPSFTPNIYSSPKSGKVTAQSGPLKLSFSVDSAIYKFEWNPCCSTNRRECLDEYTRWQYELQHHEEGHALTNNAIVREVNNNSSPCYFPQDIRSYEGTGNTQVEAEDDLYRNIQKHIDTIRCCMWDQARERIVEVHGSKTRPVPEYVVHTMNCEKCPPGTCDGSTYCLSRELDDEGQAIGQCCGPTEQCVNFTCQPRACQDCETRNPSTGLCEPVDCGDPCLECRNNSCQPKCGGAGACQTCQNGTCIDNCVGCMHCENGLCVRTCTDNESCCGDQCYNGSQFRPCGPAGDGCYLCPSNTECCAGSQSCCDTTVSRCCGGQCVPYGNFNCGECRPCNPGQVCCIGPQGQIYGCDDAVNCPR